MVQGSVKTKTQRPKEITKSQKSAKQVKREQREKQVKKGNPVQLPKNKFRDEALDDRLLSKAIDKANEQKMAAKVLQDGGKIATKDILEKGKELSREQRRKQLKKKASRVEEKLKELEEKEEKEGKAIEGLL